MGSRGLLSFSLLPSLPFPFLLTPSHFHSPRYHLLSLAPSPKMQLGGQGSAVSSPVDPRRARPPNDFCCISASKNLSRTPLLKTVVGSELKTFKMVVKIYNPAGLKQVGKMARYQRQRNRRQKRYGRADPLPTRLGSDRLGVLCDL